MNSQIENTLNQFLEQFYGHDRKALAVQKYRWRNRMKKDPKDFKNSDLTMYNLLVFASGRKEQEKQEQEVKDDEEIMKLTMEERIEQSIVPKSETAEDVEINYKKLVDDFIPKIDSWGKSINKTNTFEELLSSRKEINKKIRVSVNDYIKEYEDLFDDDDDTFDELDEYSEKKLVDKVDKIFDKIQSKLPLVKIIHPLTNRIFKRAYTNDEVIKYMNEIVDKADGMEKARLTNWKRENEAELIAELHDNIDKHKRYIKSL